MAGDESEIHAILARAATQRSQALSEARNQPFRMPSVRVATSETYAACITPKDAIKKYSYSTADLVVTQLHRELQSGRVQAVCHQAIAAYVHPEGAGGAQTFVIVDPWVWQWNSPPRDNDFWETGFLQLDVPTTVGGSGLQCRIDFFDIRFWPDGLPGGADRVFPVGTEPEAIPSNLPPKSSLSKSDAEKFCAAINAGWPSATQDWAHEKAVRFFPNNEVPRDWFRSILRSIRGPRNPGKPPKNRD